MQANLFAKRMIVVLLFSLAYFTAKPVSANGKDHADIARVIETFKQSLQTKNESAFMALFLEKNVSWVGVISDKTLNTLATQDPKFKQQPKVMNSSPKEFIQSIVSAGQVVKEVFKNVQITQDEEVASVSFDYDFYKGDKLNNYGQEHWQLVKTKAGWKINAVNFSFNLVL
jgi:hypothetical protein